MSDVFLRYHVKLILIVKSTLTPHAFCLIPWKSVDRKYNSFIQMVQDANEPIKKSY